MKRRLSVLAVVLTVAVVAPSAAQAQGRTIGERVDDALITTTLKTKLATDQAKSLVNVDVDTRDGVVHLQGMVPTEQDRMNAERLARGTKGVVDVRNDLQVAGAVTPRERGAASPRTR